MFKKNQEIIAILFFLSVSITVSSLSLSAQTQTSYESFMYCMYKTRPHLSSSDIKEKERGGGGNKGSDDVHVRFCKK